MSGGKISRKEVCTSEVRRLMKYDIKKCEIKVG
jgi:hypothetical protein